jgi:hypothetical protein
MEFTKTIGSELAQASDCFSPLDILREAHSLFPAGANEL